MMYPVLEKVRYAEIQRITADRRMMTASLVLNWVIGPAVMFALAWLLLSDQPAYRTGVLLVGAKTAPNLGARLRSHSWLATARPPVRILWLPPRMCIRILQPARSRKY
jgi:Sodium Bile acid symporter family